MQLARGHVVALRRAGVGVVWCANSEYVWVAPVGGCNGPPHHRAEVRVQDKDDIAAMGLPFKYPVVRCQTLLKVERTRLPQQAPIGKTPPGILARIIGSMQREANSQAAEGRMMFMHRQTGFRAVAVL